MLKKGIAILGGSFDPIHQGHIQIARDIQNRFHFEKIIFMPCGQPVFKRQTHASNTQRLDMLKLALGQYKDFIIDTREFSRQGPSYSIFSLEEFRQEYPQEPIIWLMGEDAFSHIQKWHRFEDLFKLAHLVILARPNTSPIWRKELKPILKKYQTQNMNALRTHPYGKIYIFEHTNYPYASSDIRNAIQINQIPQGLPDNVKEYIQNHRIYLSHEN